MQRESKPRRGMAPTFPTQASLCHPVPVVRLTFSRRVSWLTNAFAFVMASAQSPVVSSTQLFSSQQWCLRISEQSFAQCDCRMRNLVEPALLRSSPHLSSPLLAACIAQNVEIVRTDLGRMADSQQSPKDCCRCCWYTCLSSA